MRSDQTLDADTFAKSPDWKFDAVEQTEKPDIDTRYERGGVEVDNKHLRHSFSGHERNCWFYNLGGGGFVDLSALSGLDNIADGRAHVVWDFDRDGWTDVALVNANEPLLNLYHNRLGRARTREQPMIAVRLVGGHHNPTPSAEFSNRDGYGTVVTVTTSDGTFVREHRCGEGFAAQNSSVLRFGLADSPVAKTIDVAWPSGKTTRVSDIAAGSELTIYEHPNQSPNGEVAVVGQYGANKIDPRVLLAGERQRLERLAGFDSLLQRDAETHVLISMATWCDACKRELPQVEVLRGAFGESVVFWGIPVDSLDNLDKLEAYQQQYRPAYQLVTDLSSDQVDNFLRIVRRVDPAAPLPATVIVNATGEVLAAYRGVPSVSDVARVRLDSQRLLAP